MLFYVIVLIFVTIASIWCAFLSITTLIDILQSIKKIEEQRKKDEEFIRFVKQARAISSLLLGGPIKSETIIINGDKL